MNLKYRHIDNLFEYCYEEDDNQLPDSFYRLKGVSSIATGLGFLVCLSMQ